ncbi:MAG TPA: hypothetical protein IAB62_02465 [Candidatus Coprocola pullicola]|nr:hypothetical protein [Candidatus Coprocola pullicola]
MTINRGELLFLNDISQDDIDSPQDYKIFGGRVYTHFDKINITANEAEEQKQTNTFLQEMMKIVCQDISKRDNIVLQQQIYPYAISILEEHNDFP